MNNEQRLDVSKYKLIIFDWDGTLVDSLPMYKVWDQLYVERFYDVKLPLEYFEELTRKIKQTNPGRSEDEYFLYLDRMFGDGKTAIEMIWKNIYSLAPEIQRSITYKPDAPVMLRKLRVATNAKIALATNAELKDIAFFSSDDSLTAKTLPPIGYFDKIVTLDDVQNPKPHPESFQKVVEHFSLDAEDVLVFEDSLHGLMAAKAAGLSTVLVSDGSLMDSQVEELADYTIHHWREIIEQLN